MALKTKELLKVDKMNVLADKGYHTGDQIQQCVENDITTFVSPKEPATKDIGLYPITMFTYDKETDTYTCPQGSILQTTIIGISTAKSTTKKVPDTSSGDMLHQSAKHVYHGLNARKVSITEGPLIEANTLM